MTTTNTATLFLAYNEDGEVAADMDRDAAIERLRDEIGGTIFRVVEMTISLPAIPDLQATFTVPAEKAEPVTVEAH